MSDIGQMLAAAMGSFLIIAAVVAVLIVAAAFGLGWWLGH